MVVESPLVRVRMQQRMAAENTHRRTNTRARERPAHTIARATTAVMDLPPKPGPHAEGRRTANLH
jgi:hypothetical protein